MRRVGAPVMAGTTRLEREGDVLTATTLLKDKPIIRTRTRVSSTYDRIISGQFRIISQVGRKFMSGRYPAIAQCADTATVLSVEFLNPRHPVYALRPKEPLEIEFCYYSPDITFAYPGGLESVSTRPKKKR